MFCFYPHTNMAQYFFTNSHLSIHAIKDFSNLDKNFKNLDEVVSKLDLSQENILKNFPNASYAPFAQWLESQITNCSDKITYKADKAKNILKNAINWNERNPRNILGEALSFITGVESPSESLLRKKTMQKMEKTLKGEVQEMNSIEHVLDEEVEIIDNVRSQVNTLFEKELKNAKIVDLFIEYLKVKHNDENICHQGEHLADIILDEANIILEIKQDSRFSRVSTNLFPIDTVFEKVNSFNSKYHTPAFTNLDDLEHLIPLAYSHTVFNGSKIISILQVPLIDKSQEFKEIIYPIMNDLALEQLEQLRTSMHRSYDLFLCSKKDKFIKIISRSDIEFCQKTPTNSLIICPGRKLKQKLKNFAQPCQNLPENLILELEYDKIFVKTNEKSLTINCGFSDKKILMNSTNSIINLDPACKLVGKDFILEKVEPDSISEDIVSKPFEALDLKVVPIPMTKQPSHIDEDLKDFKSKQINSSTIHRELEILKTQDQENRNDVNSIEGDLKNNQIYNWSATGGVFLIFLAIICSCVCYLKKS